MGTQSADPCPRDCKAVVRQPLCGIRIQAFFDPDHARRSLGTLAILAGLDWAREREIQYYYLGFYIPGHPKMDYKRHFMPAEIRDPVAGRWVGAPYAEIAALAD